MSSVLTRDDLIFRGKSAGRQGYVDVSMSQTFFESIQQVLKKMKGKSVPGDIFLDDLTSTHAAQQDVWYAGSLNTPSAEYDLVEEKKLRSQFQYTQKPFNRDELYER